MAGGLRDRGHILGDARIDHEGHRPFALFSGLQRVLRKAKALQLVEMRGRLAWRIARYRLGRHAAVLHILELVHDRGQLARMDLDGALRRLEVPDRKSTRLNSSHSQISYAVFCLK